MGWEPFDQGYTSFISYFGIFVSCNNKEASSQNNCFGANILKNCNSNASNRLLIWSSAEYKIFFSRNIKKFLFFHGINLRSVLHKFAM